MSAIRTLQRALPRSRPAMSAPIMMTNRPRLFHATASAQAIHELKSKSDFDAAVKQHKTIIIDAFAEWCGPCHMISPIYAKLSDAYPSIRFYKFDVDHVQDLSAALEIRAMPTFSIFQDGKRLEQVVGANPQALKVVLDRLSKED
ncbi:thioredoxin [Grosmannia clavigera kw1407]|uniref:Thioredoxin n=1 Tax=Grosmannia clavigera (strain kw1407 / UAMH 11150) TaxID=655863 RepID=F0X8E9_GROCL|nr:thioredoxin [Grosmannia clavigera kw1407]EFX05748.1 thioredoxin [Grosmannia clavigera kw1407]